MNDLTSLTVNIQHVVLYLEQYPTFGGAKLLAIAHPTDSRYKYRVMYITELYNSLSELKRNLCMCLEVV